jgi:hypothetical protein
MIGGDSGLQRLGARNYDTIACMIVCWAQSMPTVGHRRMYVKATYNIHVWRPIYGLKQQHARTDLQTRPITTTIHGKYKLRNTPKLFPAIYVVNHVFLCIWLCDLMHICKTKKNRPSYQLLPTIWVTLVLNWKPRERANTFYVSSWYHLSTFICFVKG